VERLDPKTQGKTPWTKRVEVNALHLRETMATAGVTNCF
jgi:hypothetical protein